MLLIACLGPQHGGREIYQPDSVSVIGQLCVLVCHGVGLGMLALPFWARVAVLSCFFWFALARISYLSWPGSHWRIGSLHGSLLFSQVFFFFFPSFYILSYIWSWGFLNKTRLFLLGLLLNDHLLFPLNLPMISLQSPF